jgi:hypothetical protein
MVEERRSLAVNSAVLFAAYEYALVVLPVALFVFLQSLEAKDPLHLFTYTPEWNIATIFLVVQGQSLYRFEAEEMGGRRSRPATGLLALAASVMIVLAASNILFAFRHETFLTAVCMWCLFLLSSLAFMAMVTGARFVGSRTNSQVK